MKTREEKKKQGRGGTGNGKAAHKTKDQNVEDVHFNGMSSMDSSDNLTDSEA